MTKIKDLHKSDRPRERLMKMGSGALKNRDLLAIMLGSGYEGKNAISVAGNLLKRHSLEKVAEMPFEKLKKLKGIGDAKACKLMAAFELSRRAFSVKPGSLPAIQAPEDVLAIVSDIRKNRKEHLVALYLNARNQLLHRETISVGSLNANKVHPREVFSPALEHLAASVILAHNHPSGDAEPSEEDVKVTKNLAKAGRIMGIEVLDHVVLGKDSLVSMKENNLF